MISKYSKPTYLFVVLLIIIPLTTSHLLIDPALLPKQFLFSLFTLLLSFFVLFNKDKKGVDNGNFIFVLIGVFLLLSAISIFNAINRGEAIWEWIKTSNHLLFIPLGYFALRKSNREDLIKLLSIVVSIVALMVVVSGLFQFAGLLISEEYGHQLTYEIKISFGHRNLYSQFLLLCMPFVMMGIVKFKNRLRLFLIILLFLIVLLIVVLLTKSVWVSLFGASLQTFILSLFLIRDKKTKKFIVPISAFFIAIIISSVALIKLTSVETFKKQTDFVWNYKYGSSLERINLWKKTIQIYEESPVFGIGQASWKIHIPKFGTDEMHSSEGNIHFQRPHNDYLWILAENGIIALIIYLIILAGFYFYAFSNLIRAKSLEDKTLSIILLFGLTSFLLVSFLSFPKERVEHTFYFSVILILILLTRTKADSGKRKVPYRRIVAITGLIISIAALVVGVIKIKSEIHILNALGHKSKSSWKNVIKEIGNAEGYFCKTDPTATPLCWYSGSAYFNIGDKENAFIQFKKAIKIHPNHVHVLNNLATSYELMGKHDSAILLYDRAINISSGFIDPYINLCAVYFNTGQIDLAIDVLKKVETGDGSEKYNYYLLAVLKEKIRLTIKMVDEIVLVEKLNGVAENNDWIMVVYGHSVEKNIDYASQLIEEVIYSLEIIDKKLSHDEAEQLRKKYMIK